jgi:hypothetical protein
MLAIAMLNDLPLRRAEDRHRVVAVADLPAPRRVVNFEQTYPRNATQIGIGRGGKVMAIPKNGKQKEYARYAAHCLNMVTVAKDSGSRAIQREMAAEWLKLADAVRRRSRPGQTQ